MTAFVDLCALHLYRMVVNTEQMWADRWAERGKEEVSSIVILHRVVPILLKCEFQVDISSHDAV